MCIPRRLGHRPPAGVTLVEIIVVTIIIGILASLDDAIVPPLRSKQLADVAAANLCADRSSAVTSIRSNTALYAPDLATLYSLDLT